MNKLNKLMFVMSLVDKVSSPVGKVQQKLNNLFDLTKKGARNMALGFAGVAGSVFLLTQAMQPAIEMDKAVGEVRSLGVREDALKSLNQTALEFSTQYGESATNFVRSSYDIQSSMAGLKGDELAGITKSAALFAKGTKGDMETSTEYFGKMYNIFKQDADKMGRIQWAQKLANESAIAVQQFRTTGDEFASAFSTLGAGASSFGIDTAEQFAILGQLQGSLSGSEAGTAYSSFLQGVGKAQERLGLQFTDSHGKMLPMVDILGELESKFGNLSKLTVKQKDAIKDAFGRKEAVKAIELLSTNIDGLQNNIKTFSDASGMSEVEFMANSMVDPWDRLRYSIEAVQISFGQALLPILIPLVDKLSEGAGTLQKWTKEFPHLSKAVGTGVLVVFGLVAALGAFKLALGLTQMAIVGFKGVLLLLNGAWWLVNGGLLNFLSTMAMGAVSGFLKFKGLVVSMITVIRGWAVSIWAANAALWANPITWIIAAILALIGVVVYLVKNWDELKASWGDSAIFGWVFSGIDMISEAISTLIDWVVGIGEWWAELILAFSETAAFKWISNALSSIGNFFGMLIDYVKNGIAWWGKLLEKLSNISIFELLGDAFAGIIDLLNMIPFVDIGGDETAAEIVHKSEQARGDFAEELPSLRDSERLEIPVGGYQQIITNQRSSTDSGTRIDSLNVYTDRSVDQEELETMIALGAG